MSNKNNKIYQRTGVTISNIALSLMIKKKGDRINTVQEYQEQLDVSRGTIQNAFKYLIDNKAIYLMRKGHQGSFIESIDYSKLQLLSIYNEILGIMPLPYSSTYMGFATALYKQMNNIIFNLTYVRGAETRIRMVESDACQFAIVSKFAAEESISNKKNIEIVMDFGVGSFLSKHILVFNKDINEIKSGMRVAYDKDSIDQREIVNKIINGKNVELINIRAQETMDAIKSNKIDAGIWNEDDLTLSHKEFNIVQIPETLYDEAFTIASIIIRSENDYIKNIILEKIKRDRTIEIIDAVKHNKTTSLV